MVRRFKPTGSALVLAFSTLLVFLLTVAISVAQGHLEPGGRAVVFGVGSLGLSVREGPGLAFPVLTLLPLDTEVDVLDGPSWSGSVPWYRITGYDRGGSRGWAAGNYLQPRIEEAEPEEEEPSQESSQESSQEPSQESSQESSHERTGSSRGGDRAGRSFIATVTGYAITGRTATGVHTEWGMVAVDPSVIPLGSKMLIDGFEDVFVAADTGGAVKGNVIDIWFPSYAEARRFGTQARRVTLLEP